MTCSACGAPLSLDARFCISCGAGVAPPAPLYGYEPAPAGYFGRVEQHLRPLGILWIVAGAYPLLGWMIALPFVAGVFHGLWRVHPGFPFALAGAWIPVVTFLLLVWAAMAAFVGVGLLRRTAWGRGVAIGFAFAAMWKVPLGTALAIYTWWVLMPQRSGWEYQRMAE